MKTTKPASTENSSRIVALALLLAAFTFALGMRAQAQTETSLFNFTLGSGGANPIAGVIIDPAANLIGTTNQGGNTADCHQFGNTGCGVVYELTQLNGSWSENVIYTFTGGSDGAAPWAGLLRDSSGNLFGTAELGGSGCSVGCGVVFALHPNGIGWTYSVLHTFTGGADGSFPMAGLAFDQAGNLYGTTAAGGNGTVGCVFQNEAGCGVVFRLSPGTGGWRQTVLHTFTGGSDGSAPIGGVAVDSTGNIFGTASTGGALNGGVAFELKRNAGTWNFGVIHAFTRGNDGNLPENTLVLDSAGNLYGTAELGGAQSDGTVFKLSKNSSGGWKFNLLHTFTGGSDGKQPLGNLALDSAGSVYGTTTFGGMINNCFGEGCGVVYKLTPGSGGAYTETVLHIFISTGSDGTNPFGGVALDTVGNVFGTTNAGGSQASGTVFQVTP